MSKSENPEAFAQFVKLALNATSLADEQNYIEKACAEAKTLADFEKLLAHFDAREIGSHIADWAEESAFHPFESAGYAMITLEDGAVIAHWDEQGFWDVSCYENIDEAQAIIDEANADWTESEDEDEDESAGE